MAATPKLYMITGIDWEDNEFFSAVKVALDKDDIVEFIKERETDGEPFKSFEVSRKTISDTSPISYMDLFGKYDFYIDKTKMKNDRGRIDDVWEVKFPQRAVTYTVRPISFSDYDVIVTPRSI